MDLCKPLVFENIDIETVVNTHSHAILRYCHSILCDYHEAQDTLQITFIKAWQNKNKFNGNGSGKDLLNFLYKIAYNACIDAIRRRRQRLKIPAEPEQSQTDNGYIPENIKAALMSLPPLDRAVTYSHAVDEMTFAELAQIYGKNAAALRKRYERARKKLGKILEKDYPNYTNTKGENYNDE
jgi:RNA polymerase sigma-70 factor (ECF subfamily)